MLAKPIQTPPLRINPTKKDNMAVLHFTGRGTQANDQRKYEAWYSIDTLIYLANCNLPITSIAYIFHSENTETRYISFKNQLRHFIVYKDRISTGSMACFIAFEAAQFATSHFIVGLLVDNILLFINPLGKSKPDFYQYLSKIQATLLNNYTIYISNTVIQKDDNGVVSCGPLCVEILKHFASLDTATFKNDLSRCSSSRRSEQELQFIQVDILSMLPVKLQNLASLTRGDPALRMSLETMREEHLNMLVDLNDTQCEDLKSTTVQTQIFEAIRKDEEEARNKGLGLSEEECQRPELKPMNRALEYLLFSLEQIIEDLQNIIFTNISLRWQMFSKTLIFLQNHYSQYFSFVENSHFLPVDKIKITVTLSSIQNYTNLFRKLFDCFNNFSQQKVENINRAQFYHAVEMLRDQIPPVQNFKHQDWASTNLTKLEAILLPLQLEHPTPPHNDPVPQASMKKPIAKHPPIKLQPPVRSFRENTNCSIEFILICLDNIIGRPEYFTKCLITIFHYLDKSFHKEFSFFQQSLPLPNTVVKIMAPDNTDGRLNEIFITLNNLCIDIIRNQVFLQNQKFLSNIKYYIAQIRKYFGKLENFDIFKFAKIELDFDLDVSILPNQSVIPKPLNELAISEEVTSEITSDSVRNEIHSFLKTASDEPGLDPFYWQIDQLYRGSLRTFDRLTPDELDRIIDQLIYSIEQLNVEGFFKDLEQDIRERVHMTLRGHLEDLISYESFKNEQRAIEDAWLEHKVEIAARRAEYKDNPEEWEYDYDGMRYPSDLEDNNDDLSSDRESSESASENHSDKFAQSDDSERDSSELISEHDNTSWHDDESSQENNCKKEDSAYLAWREEKRDELGDLDDLQNVISICTGPEGLNWLVHQYAEYEIEVNESLIKEIRLRNMSLEPEVVIHILETMFMERGYDANSLHKDGFAAKAFIESLLDMEEGDPAEEEDPFVTTKTHIVRKINSRFARLKDLIEQGKLQTLRQAYNAAYAVNNHFEMQKYWYVFTKVQRLLRSAEGSRTATPLPLVGKDYSFKREPLTYEQLLQMAYDAYEARSNSLHYRIFPTEGTRYLSYRSRKKPGFVATLDIEEVFEELATVGIKVENILRSYNQNFTNNIIVPTFYFVVSDIPHQKGGKHSRKFILVDLILPALEFLLSNDRDDGVFPNYEEKQFLQYRIEKANEDYEAGCNIIKVEKKQTKQPPCSEKGLFELLQRHPEIVNSLLQEMEKALPMTTTQGKYKIYGGGIISYSTNSTCDFCTLSYIALQNSYHEGFLTNFINRANTVDSRFKTRGFAKGQPRKFLFHTLVQFRECYTVQALDLHDLSSERIERMKVSEIPIYRNPDAKLHFKDNAIDVHKPSREDVPSVNVALIEFIRPTATQKSSQIPYKDHGQQRFTFYGHTYMSGSKKRDFPNKAAEINLSADQMIREHRKMSQY